MLCGLGIQLGKGYAALRARRCTSKGCSAAARRLLAGVRARARRAFARQPEVRRPPGHDRLLHRAVVQRSPGLRAQPLQVRRERQLHVLGHERLRPLPEARSPPSTPTGPAAAVLLAVVGYLFWVRGTASDWRARLRDRRARASRRRSERSQLAGAVAMRRIRRLHLLQHEHPQHVRDDARPGAAPGRLREAVQVARQPAAAASITDVDRDGRPLSVRAARAHARHATRCRIAAGSRSTGSPAVPAVRTGCGSIRCSSPRRAQIVDRRSRHGGCAVYRLATAARAGGDARARLRSRDSDAGLHERERRRPTSSTTARSSTARPCSPSSATTSACELDDATATARSTAWRRRNAMRRRDDPCGLQHNGLARRRRLDHLRRDRRAPRPTRSRSRRATCSANGPRTAAATSTTRWTSPILNFFAFLSARYAVRKRPRGTTSRSRSTTTPATPTTSTG